MTFSFNVTIAATTLPSSMDTAHIAVPFSLGIPIRTLGLKRGFRSAKIARN
jgi:hypothetical protein